MVWLLYRLMRWFLRWSPWPGQGLVGIRTRYSRHEYYLHRSSEPGSINLSRPHKQMVQKTCQGSADYMSDEVEVVIIAYLFDLVVVVLYLVYEYLIVL